MFQKYMEDASQLCDYFDKNIFSNHYCGFRKGFSTLYAILVMIEKMKIARDSKNFYAAILTDLVESFRLYLSRSPHCETKRLWIRSKRTEAYPIKITLVIDRKKLT